MRMLTVFLAAGMAGLPAASEAIAGIGGIPTNLQQVRIGNAHLLPDTAMTPPVALVHPAPRYTAEALAWGIEGVVTVAAEFDIDGNFEVLRVVKGLPFGLDAMALEALGGWRFRPAYRSGRRVPVVANIDVEFTRRGRIGFDGVAAELHRHHAEGIPEVMTQHMAR